MSIIEREQVTEVPSILDPRVERGAALLDEKMPGWAERVNVDTLDIQDSDRCVLGQTCGYLNSEDAVGIAFTSSGIMDHGFCALPEQYPTINQDWRLAILSRRES